MGKVDGVVTGVRECSPRAGRDRRRRRPLRAGGAAAGRWSCSARPTWFGRRTTSPSCPGTPAGTPPARCSTAVFTGDPTSRSGLPGDAGGAPLAAACEGRLRRRRPVREPGADADRAGPRRQHGLTPLDLYVARAPPSAAHFRSQRVRQAYDDFAIPARMAPSWRVGAAGVELAPGGAPGARGALGSVGLAEVGGGGRRSRRLPAQRLAAGAGSGSASARSARGWRWGAAARRRPLRRAAALPLGDASAGCAAAKSASCRPSPSARALSERKPIALWVPSQKGRMCDLPQRQRATTAALTSISLPSWSKMMKGPRTR